MVSAKCLVCGRNEFAAQGGDDCRYEQKIAVVQERQPDSALLHRPATVTTTTTTTPSRNIFNELLLIRALSLMVLTRVVYAAISMEHPGTIVEIKKLSGLAEDVHDPMLDNNIALGTR
jgi:hypothetical protein